MFIQQYPNLFKPIKIRDLTVRNRIMSSPNLQHRVIDGRPDLYYVKYLEHKARGGAGIVTLGEANVCDGGNHVEGMETTFENLTVYAEIAQAIHEHGAIASVELTHGGMNVDPRYNKNPNRIMGPCDFEATRRGARGHAMTEEDIEFVANGFADTAEYYFSAGFDTVLLHCAHGWLLTQFLSPVINKRTDDYGGCLENRIRFPLYVMKKVRERAGPDKAVTVRLSGSERHPDGFSTQDVIEFLAKAQEYVDMAEISTEDFRYVFASTYMEYGQNVPFAEQIKKSGRVNIPIYSVGSIMRPEQAEEIIASGKADGVSMSRALIADPFLPKKAAEGHSDEITPCLRCLSCVSNDNAYRHFICSVNPLVSREVRLGFNDDMSKAKESKKVLVVGGGPAGMQAAITASERGHDVTLVERDSTLGGLLRFSVRDNIKHDLRRYMEFLIRKVGNSGAKILLNTEITAELADKTEPDHIIVATGSRPVTPKIEGIEKARHATAVYFDPGFKTGDSVIIIGGGLVGVECGLHLSSLGKRVTVLEFMDEYAAGTVNVARRGLEYAVEKSGIKIIVSAKTFKISETGIDYEKDGKKAALTADTVLYATGMQPYEEPYFSVYDKAPFVSLIGDAKKVGKVDGAVYGGYFAAMDI